VILDGLSVQTLLAGFVIENFRNDNFFRDILAVFVFAVRIAICCIALGEARGIAKTSRVEEWVRLVDAGVDIANLNASAGSRPAASGSPGVGRVNDLIGLAQIRVVERVVLGALHHWSGYDCRQRRAVELDRHGVK
jgi:hypothetical protein